MDFATQLLSQPLQVDPDFDLDFSDIFQLLNSPQSIEFETTAAAATELPAELVDYDYDSGGSQQTMSIDSQQQHESHLSGNLTSDSEFSGGSPPLKGTDARRAASRIGARRRRGSETKLLQELAQVIAPVGVISGRGVEGGKLLDKMSTLRLAVSQLKLRRVLASLGGGGAAAVVNGKGEAGSELSFVQVEDALGGGFLLTLSTRGEILYVSSTVSNSLGFSALEMMGRSLYDFSNPADHADIGRLLAAADYGHVPSRQRHSGLLRLRCSTRTTRDPGHMRADPYKVFHVSGKLHTSEDGVSFFVGVADPIPHPADNRFPFWHWLNQQIFTTVHSLDMKFVCADASMSRILGYAPEDYVGHTCYNFIHPEDVIESTTHIRTLYEKGQVQTDQFRILKKGGGHVWVYTQKTSLNSNAVISSRNRTIVVCRHFLLGVEDGGGEVHSRVQIGGEPRPVWAPAPKQSSKYAPPTPPSSVGEAEQLGGGVVVDGWDWSELEEGSSFDVGDEGDLGTLRSLAAEVDLEALPAFTDALDTFFYEGGGGLGGWSAGDEELPWSSDSCSMSPPPQILGKRTRRTDGVVSKTNPVVPAESSHTEATITHTAVCRTANKFPTLTSLLQTGASKKYKSTLKE